MAQYQVTYTLFTDSSHSTSQPGMFSLTTVVNADSNQQACDIVQSIFGPNAGNIQAQQM